MSAKQLDVAERSPRFMCASTQFGKERSTTSVTGATIKAHLTIDDCKPVHYASGEHIVSLSGFDDSTLTIRCSAQQCYQCCPYVGVHRYASSMFLLGDPVLNLDRVRDLARRIEDHRPFKLGNFCCSKAGAGAE